MGGVWPGAVLAKWQAVMYRCGDSGVNMYLFAPLTDTRYGILLSSSLPRAAYVGNPYVP